MRTIDLSTNGFGDPYDLADLPLPRPAIGYGVQKLDTDQLLDRETGTFASVRDQSIAPTFANFDAAARAAQNWSEQNLDDPMQHTLAIVPLGYDANLERHILIYGVLRAHP